MPNIKQIIIDRTEIYRTQFIDLTVSQIDELKNEYDLPLKPSGRMSGIAWDNARTEKLNEEIKQTRIDELKILLPSISDEDIEKINIDNEDNNEDGFVIKEIEGI